MRQVILGFVLLAATGCARPADRNAGFLLGGHYRALDVDARALELEPWGPIAYRPELGQPFVLVRGGPSFETDVWQLDGSHRRVAVYRVDRRGTILEAWRLRVLEEGPSPVLLVEEARPWTALRPDRPRDPGDPYRAYVARSSGAWVEDGEVGRALPPSTAPLDGETVESSGRRIVLSADRRRVRLEDGRTIRFERHPIDDVIDFVREDAGAHGGHDHRTDPGSPPIWWEDGPAGPFR